jgi:GTP cyclohydrolase I
MCEHHLLPFWGKANIGYIPSNKIVGLSKISRALDVLAKRPQVQERLTNQMKDCLITKLNPHALIVYIEAEHLCMTMRGIKQPGSSVITIAQFKSSNEQTHNLELLTSMIK